MYTSYDISLNYLIITLFLVQESELTLERPPVITSLPEEHLHVGGNAIEDTIAEDRNTPKTIVGHVIDLDTFVPRFCTCSKDRFPAP